MRRLITVSIEGSLTVDEAHQVAEAINLARRTGKPLVLGGGAVVRTHDLGTQPPKAHVERCTLARLAPRLRQQGQERRIRRRATAQVIRIRGALDAAHARHTAAGA